MRGWVWVKSETLAPESILEALKQGDYYSSQGPRIDDISIDGEEISVACSPASWIIAAGAGLATRCAHGQDVTRAILPIDCFAGGYVRITVTDDKGRLAWSNPIWL